MSKWPWILGGAAVAAGVYFLTRPSTAAASPVPGLPTTPGASVPDSGATGYQLGGSVYESALPSSTDLLRSSEAARQVYAFQLLAYVFGLTQTPPGGIVTTDTTQVLSRVYADVGQTAPAGFTAGAINVMGQAIIAENGGQVPDAVNTQPSLPTDVAALIHAEIPASVRTQLQIG